MTGRPKKMPMTMGDRVLHGHLPNSSELKYTNAKSARIEAAHYASSGENNQVDSSGVALNPRLRINGDGVVIFDKERVYKMLI